MPKYNPKDWDFKICSIQMLRIIWRVCEWNENDTYRIAGTHYPEYNLVSNQGFFFYAYFEGKLIILCFMRNF